MSKFGILFGILSIILLSSSMASAFGVAAEYWQDRPLEVSPGQTVNTYFKIQNVGDSVGDITVKASVIEGAEYATLLDGDTYSVSVGQQKDVPVEISMPEDVTVGRMYPIKVLFQQVSQDSGNGPLEFSFNVEREFGVVIVESGGVQQVEDDEGKNGLWLWIVGLIVLVVLIWIVMVSIKRK